MTDHHAPDPHSPLRQTPLYRRHVQLGARMVPFAGYEMPVQYPDGIIAEHTQTRTAAGLFDVSHMGQACLSGPDHETIARALEALTPADILGLAPGQQRYTQLLNEAGGILDDLMVTRPADPQDHRLMLVVNAARKQFDYGHIEARLPADVRLTRFDDRGLLALQGPLACAVLERFVPEVGAMPFMTAIAARFDGIDCASQPFRLHRRGRLRAVGRCGTSGDGVRPPARRAGGQAGRPWRARHAAARGRALPLRTRHRRDDLAGRGRPCLVDRQAAQGRGRLPRRRDACRASLPTARRGAASAFCPKGARRRARARRSSHRTAMRSDCHVRRLRPDRQAADCDGLCR